MRHPHPRHSRYVSVIEPLTRWLNAQHSLQGVCKPTFLFLIQRVQYPLGTIHHLALGSGSWVQVSHDWKMAPWIATLANANAARVRWIPRHPGFQRYGDQLLREDMAKKQTSPCAACRGEHNYRAACKLWHHGKTIRGQNCGVHVGISAARSSLLRLLFVQQCASSSIVCSTVLWQVRAAWTDSSTHQHKHMLSCSLHFTKRVPHWSCLFAL